MDASELKPPIKDPKPKSGSRWTLRLLELCLTLLVLVAIVLGIGIWRLKSGPVSLPQATHYIQKQLNSTTQDFKFLVGDVNIIASENHFNPHIELHDVAVMTPKGQKILSLPLIRTSISPRYLLKKQFVMDSIEVIGASVAIIRAKDGSYNVETSGSEKRDKIDPEKIFAGFNKNAKSGVFHKLDSIELRETRLIFIDRLRGQTWYSGKTDITALREDDLITVQSDLVLKSDNDVEMTARGRVRYQLGDTKVQTLVQFSDAATTALADQVPALEWLRSLDAKVSGSLTSIVATNGTLQDLSGVLDLQDGVLRETPQTRPIRFSKGKIYFEYDQDHDRLTMTQVDVESSVGRITGEGVAEFQRGKAGQIISVSAQVSATDIAVHPEGFFAAPLRFETASAQVQVTLSPLAVTLENLELKNQDFAVNLFGSSLAGDKYWNSSYYLQFKTLDRDALLRLWPLNLKPKTRDWISKNISTGLAKDGNGHISTRNGVVALNLRFGIEQAQVRYLKSLPPLENGKGIGYLTEKTFHVDLTEGFVNTKESGTLDVKGSRFSVPDLTIKPANGHVDLIAKGPLQAGLSLLDNKPFEYLDKVGLSPDLGQGNVNLTASFDFSLSQKTKVNDVVFKADAVIADFTSKTLIKGHDLASKAIHLTAQNKEITLTGKMTVDGVQADTTWLMPIGKGYSGGSHIDAGFALSAASLAKFGAKFDKNTLSGAAPAQLRIELHKAKDPAYTISSDLVGLGVSIAGIGWKKSKKAKAKLTLSGKMGGQFSVESLSLKAKGLSAKGALSFNKDGSLKRAGFTKLSVGNWLDAAASLQISKGKLSKIVISSGVVDLRKAPFGKSSGGGVPMDVVLDQLILADTISLKNLRAKLQTQKGLRGNYSALLNGKAKITGSIFPQKFGTAVEVLSSDSGAVLRAANLYGKAHGGDLRMVLIPEKKSGTYQGTFQIKKTRIKEDSIMADLLNGISVVGLLQQLSGEGIVFETVDGQFELYPTGVRLNKTSAVGVSVGLTLDGNYNSVNKTIDMEGVITPIYALNGSLERVFGKVFGRRKGEGLFSFVYDIQGASNNPKVSVKPLSILAPGAFREIFRRNIPKQTK